MVKNLSFLFIILLSCGCSLTKTVIVPDQSGVMPVITGYVVNSSAFEKGGSLSFSAFKPGVGAAADDQTDELSLMMIKGIKDTLPQESTPFTIPADETKDPGFYLDGYIDDYGNDRRYSHLNLRKTQVHLAVSGEIWLRDTGEKVFLFKTSTIIDLKKQNPKTVAYQIGVAIAHFIASPNS